MNNEPTVYMPERYPFSALDGSGFSNDLWQDRRFEIKLNYEPDYRIYNDPICEVLTMGITMLITRDSELEILDQYYGLLGGLEHFAIIKR